MIGDKQLCLCCIVRVFKTCECILSTDLLQHVPDIADAGKSAVGMYASIMNDDSYQYTVLADSLSGACTYCILFQTQLVK